MGSATETEPGRLAQMRQLMEEANAAREEYEKAAWKYGESAYHESLLEARRPGVKQTVVSRIMADGKVAATNAEKLATTDPEYLAHLTAQRDACADKNAAHTRMESARMRVKIALAGVRVLMGDEI